GPHAEELPSGASGRLRALPAAYAFLGATCFRAGTAGRDDLSLRHSRRRVATPRLNLPCASAHACPSCQPELTSPHGRSPAVARATSPATHPATRGTGARAVRFGAHSGISLNTGADRDCIIVDSSRGPRARARNVPLCR